MLVHNTFPLVLSGRVGLVAWSRVEGNYILALALDMSFPFVCDIYLCIFFEFLIMSLYTAVSLAIFVSIHVTINFRVNIIVTIL